MHGLCQEACIFTAGCNALTALTWKVTEIVRSGGKRQMGKDIHGMNTGFCHSPKNTQELTSAQQLPQLLRNSSYMDTTVHEYKEQNQLQDSIQPLHDQATDGTLAMLRRLHSEAARAWQAPVHQDQFGGPDIHRGSREIRARANRLACYTVIHTLLQAAFSPASCGSPRLAGSFTSSIRDTLTTCVKSASWIGSSWRGYRSGLIWQE